MDCNNCVCTLCCRYAQDKELMKKQRGKSSEKDILAEACDVLTTTFVMLTQYGVSRDYVKAQILYKCNRALERYRKTGEV